MIEQPKNIHNVYAYVLSIISAQTRLERTNKICQYKVNYVLEVKYCGILQFIYFFFLTNFKIK